jgi:release factor glutamine methyltransferase
MNHSARAEVTAAELVAWAEAEITAVTDASRLEAELLLADSVGIGRAGVMAHPERCISPEQARRLEAMVGRRRSGEPLAYILGSKEFFSLPLEVRSGVLVPRPETELLVEAALERATPERARVLDLGTGSGAIALALKTARPDLSVTAVDCDRSALDVAIANARQLDLEIRCLESDWFSALADERFDLVVANPPYVPSGDRHFASELAFEPRVALDGGVDGLDAYRSILAGVSSHLEPNGLLLLEHGFDQREAVVELAQAEGLRLEAALDDLAGLPRVAVFRGPAS